MSKFDKRGKEGLKFEPVPVPERKVIGETPYYRIKRYSLYGYQLIKQEQDGRETPIDPENTYAVVASGLADRMYKDITGDNK